MNSGAADYPPKKMAELFDWRQFFFFLLLPTPSFVLLCSWLHQEVWYKKACQAHSGHFTISQGGQTRRGSSGCKGRRTAKARWVSSGGAKTHTCCAAFQQLCLPEFKEWKCVFFFTWFGLYSSVLQRCQFSWQINWCWFISELEHQAWSNKSRTLPYFCVFQGWLPAETRSCFVHALWSISYFIEGFDHQQRLNLQLFCGVV